MTPDLTTIAGIVAISMIASGVIISKFNITDKNVKQLISAGSAIILAVGSKLANVGFADMTWQTLVVGIIGAIFATKLSYDAIVHPAIKAVKSGKNGKEK